MAGRSNTNPKEPGILWLLARFTLGAVFLCRAMLAAEPGADSPRPDVERGPVDIALLSKCGCLITANQLSNSISLLRAEDGKYLDEIPCGDYPTNVVRRPDGHGALVACAHAGTVAIVSVREQKLHLDGVVDVGFEPTGIAVHPDGQRAYVGLVADRHVAEINLKTHQVVRRIEVGHWPRYLTLNPDGARLAVGLSGEGKVVIVDTNEGKVLYDVALSGGMNLGHMQCDAAGEYVYFPWIIYRTNPINPGNIRKGWVLASRIGRVRLDGPATREAISLDVPGLAVSDPHGLCLSEDLSQLVVSASGTHELLVYRASDLPFIGAGGPGDLIDRRLMMDAARFSRIDVGGRPMGLEMALDKSIVYVANYLRNSVQWVDLKSQEIVHESNLGGMVADPVVARGRELFYDGKRSLDQWYSCHSCHYDGGTSARPMDTMNDGSDFTVKTVLPLHYVTHTHPWTWRGRQEDLEDSIQKSFTETMQGPAVPPQDLIAMKAYLSTLKLPPNPHRPVGNVTMPNQSIKEDHFQAIERGKQIFIGNRGNCGSCHTGKYFTDGENHDVGTTSADEIFNGYNTPTLLGVYRKVRWLHDGRAKSLEALLAEHHTAATVGVGEALTDQEREDLIAYLKSL